MAQKLVPAIQPKEGAEEGEVFYLSKETCVATVAKGDIIISRKNAPLLPIAFALVQGANRLISKVKI
jgi:hypothetical protein